MVGEPYDRTRRQCRDILRARAVLTVSKRGRDHRMTLRSIREKGKRGAIAADSIYAGEWKDQSSRFLYKSGVERTGSSLHRGRIREGTRHPGAFTRPTFVAAI